MIGVGAVAAWASPVLLVAVVARVAGGGVETPLFVLAVLAAPMLALLVGPGPRGARSGFARTLSLITVVCALGAGFRAVADLGHVLGLESGATLGSAVALVLVMTLWGDHHRVAATALVVGAAALLIALVIVGVAAAVAPWTAWGRVASRSAFELSPRSEWTRDGALFPEPTTLTFTEPHRITAATDAVMRVTERDRVTSVRERRLAAGESLQLRPGDSLSIPAGVRVRFEGGRRVPGSPASGVTWADGAGVTRRHLLAWWAGLTLTLAGGALMIVRPTAPPSPAAAIWAPAVVFAVTLAATCWGVYAVYVAPELAMETPATGLLVRLAPVVADEPWRSRILTAIVLALLALFLGCAASLRRCLVELTAADAADVASVRRRVVEAATWAAMVLAAAAVSLVVTDGFTLLLQGSGLAAAILLGPLLTTGEGAGVEGARAKGALAGGLIFVALAALARWPAAAGSLDALARFPALVAAPCGWLVATLSRRGE